MQWLTLWLKKIILLVLLAAFLDLILPNTNLQKYVKMVMGLIILLTVLTPLFSVFSISPDELALKIDRFQESQMKGERNQDFQPLAEKLLSHRDEQVKNYVIKGIENQIQARLKEEFHRDSATVQVTLTDGEEPKIKEVFINLHEQEQTQTQTSAPVVKPIDPVVIEVGSKDREADSLPASNQGEPSVHDDMAATVAKELQISREQIYISEDGQQANVTVQRR